MEEEEDLGPQFAELSDPYIRVFNQKKKISSPVVKETDKQPRTSPFAGFKDPPRVSRLEEISVDQKLFDFGKEIKGMFSSMALDLRNYIHQALDLDEPGTDKQMRESTSPIHQMGESGKGSQEVLEQNLELDCEEDLELDQEDIPLSPAHQAAEAEVLLDERKRSPYRRRSETGDKHKSSEWENGKGGSRREQSESGSRQVDNPRDRHIMSRADSYGSRNSKTSSRDHYSSKYRHRSRSSHISTSAHRSRSPSRASARSFQDSRGRQLSRDRECRRCRPSGSRKSRSTSITSRHVSVERRKERSKSCHSEDDQKDVDINNQELMDIVENYDRSEYNSLIFSNEPLPNDASEQKKKERLVLRARHRDMLKLTRAADKSVRLEEKQQEEQWARPSDRPSHLSDEEEEQRKPFLRLYLPKYVNQNITKTGELATKKSSEGKDRVPIELTQIPAKKKIFTSSFEPADAARFPQDRLSSDTARKLADKIGWKKWKKPSILKASEEQIQDWAAHGRTEIHGIAFVEQLLRVIKVLIRKSKDSAPDKSQQKSAAQIIMDMVDRGSEVLNQLSLQAMQDILSQTMMLRVAYIQDMRIPREDKEKLRSASLFSSKVLPSKVVGEVIDNFQESASVSSAKNLETTLARALDSRPTSNKNKGGSGSSSASFDQNRNQGRGRGYNRGSYRGNDRGNFGSDNANKGMRVSLDLND
jgi:hypothetical protein